MTVDDIPTVFQIGSTEFDLQKNIYHRTWNLVELSRHLNNEKDLAIIAELNGHVVGFALGHNRFSGWENDLGYLEWIAVSGEHQRKGVGTALVDEIIVRFSNFSVKKILADTKIEESRKLLANFNFKKAFTVNWLIRDVS